MRQAVPTLAIVLLLTGCPFLLDNIAELIRVRIRPDSFTVRIDRAGDEVTTESFEVRIFCGNDVRGAITLQQVVARTPSGTLDNLVNVLRNTNRIGVAPGVWFDLAPEFSTALDTLQPLVRCDGESSITTFTNTLSVDEAGARPGTYELDFVINMRDGEVVRSGHEADDTSSDGLVLEVVERQETYRIPNY